MNETQAPLSDEDLSALRFRVVTVDGQRRGIKLEKSIGSASANSLRAKDEDLQTSLAPVKGTSKARATSRRACAISPRATCTMSLSSPGNAATYLSSPVRFAPVRRLPLRSLETRPSSPSTPRSSPTSSPGTAIATTAASTWSEAVIRCSIRRPCPPPEGSSG